MKTLFSLSISMLLMSGAVSAHGQSLRCQGDLARPGDSKASVLQKCGEPQHKDSFCQEVKTAQSETATAVVVPCEQIDTWTYNPGTGQFLTQLRFRAGKVDKIEYGDRVK